MFSIRPGVLVHGTIKYINSALKEELADSVVVAKFANTTQHGSIEGKTQTHEIDYFNLETFSLSSAPSFAPRGRTLTNGVTIPSHPSELKVKN